jgi:DNA-directed RNA polymerase specialized sigma subunit
MVDDGAGSDEFPLVPDGLFPDAPPAHDYGSTPEGRKRREAAIVKWMPLAEKLAKKYVKRGEDDAQSVAYLALVEAYDAFISDIGDDFDPYRVPREKFLTIRIRDALLAAFGRKRKFKRFTDDAGRERDDYRRPGHSGCGLYDAINLLPEPHKTIAELYWLDPENQEDVEAGTSVTHHTNARRNEEDVAAKLNISVRTLQRRIAEVKEILGKELGLEVRHHDDEADDGPTRDAAGD